ncbi:MAG: TlpA family protein disulfide reductase [Planctomycetes bacterium]|nr:TlpA family protein disulfide reductase [Planctomycetota bacterium]MCH8968610.1 TlpA family protein disulfide reductase [Planctomycetota bacterium]
MKRLVPILILLAVVFAFNSRRSVLRAGAAAPALSADTWINTNGALELSDLKGKVVVVEFWATWCGPCVASIPNMNKLHDRWKDKDVVVIGLTDESPEDVQRFVRKNGIRYAVGAGSLSSFDYGVRSIPHAFVIAGDGTVVWNGYPGRELDQAVAQAHKSLSQS